MGRGESSVTTLSEVLRRAAELQNQVWKALEPIYAALGYSEFPPEHVIAAVIENVERGAAALGTDRERIELFRARKAIEDKRALVVPEDDQCPFCLEPLAAADTGVRECPECRSKIDRSGAEVRS